MRLACNPTQKLSRSAYTHVPIASRAPCRVNLHICNGAKGVKAAEHQEGKHTFTIIDIGMSTGCINTASRSFQRCRPRLPFAVAQGLSHLTIAPTTGLASEVLSMLNHHIIADTYMCCLLHSSQPSFCMVSDDCLCMLLQGLYITVVTYFDLYL